MHGYINSFHKIMSKFRCLIILGIVLLVASCHKGEAPGNDAALSDEWKLPGDRAIYGLTCDGCTDSVFVLLPLDCSDPISFNIIKAHKQKKVLGHAKIGDWVAVVPSEEDSTVAELVVNLDELKGTWCYIVMPRLRMAPGATAKDEARMMSEMPDSVKETYFIPREYGFALKQQWQAHSVGYVRQNTTIEDESPVVYPRLAYFTKWKMWNGKLIITSGEPVMNEEAKKFDVINEHNDTCDILYLMNDSLVLGSEGATRGYYRHNNVSEVNKEANAAAEKIHQQALDELKK